MYGWDPKFLKKNPVVLLEEETLLPPGVRSFVLHTPIQIEIVARQLAWETVLEEVQIVETKGSYRYLSLFKKVFGTAHLAAKLLLSDAADYGTGAVKNALLSRNRKTRSALSLAGAFSNIPAIIVGAGPSLPKLDSFADKALIFAGGRALDRIDVEPHFAAAIDKEGPIKKIPASHIPFCFQSRLNPAVLSKVHGPLIRAPETHFSFLRWLEGETQGFDGGWTVGNFIAALATLWGCNPIIAVGMDFCHGEPVARVACPGKLDDFGASCQSKQAGSSLVDEALPKVRRGDNGSNGAKSTGLTGQATLATGSGAGQVEALDRKGRKVTTQPDWLMGAQWMEKLAQEHAEKTFLDGCGEGLSLGWTVKRLAEIELPKREGLREQVRKAVEALPAREDTRWEEWREKLEAGEEREFETLWEVWRPIFEGKGDLEIHRTLFLEQVRGEHLDVLR